VDIENFRDAISQATGGAPSHSEIIPGKLVRFPTSERKGNKSGWCKLFEDGEGGVFGCWRQGISETWQAKSDRNPEDQAVFLIRVKQAQAEATKLRAEIQKECREKSAALWEKGRDVAVKHPYLTTKGIKPHGIKQLRNLLIVPVRDHAGNLHGLQFILPDGSKRFKSGTALSGCYHAIGKPDDRILIAEGYATGATLHEVTGRAVACAFTASNLKPVAEAIRQKYPDTLLVICADDDYLIEGNPGLTKATEASRAVNALLAVPCFPATRTEKDTDFNDMARLAGPEAVMTCIEAATIPSEESPSPSETESTECPLDAVIQRLSQLSPLQYDQVRKKEAKALGVRPITLDAAVKDARKGGVADDLPFVEVEPWPDAIDQAQLLTDISATVRRFIVCEKETADAVALWAAMTWFINVVQVAPLAVITAPEKRCGKSQLLFLMGRLSARAITTSSISPAALYRTIDAWCPTLLIDEADAFMKDNEELRGLLNSGHTRESAYVIRTVGDSFTPTKFNTWGAKALAGIGHVADTLMDRAVILELRRKLPHEEVARIRHAEPNLFADFRSKLARFADDYRDQLRQTRPPLPQCLNDRAQDNWEPLLAIAMTASDEWLQLGTTAALKLSSSESAAQTVGTELLADIQEIFGDDREKITTAELIRLLCADEEKPWATFNRGRCISPRQVAKRLKEYGILSHTIRIGNETAKGYTVDQFKEAFSRYLSSSPELPVTTSRDRNHSDMAVTDNPSRIVTVTDNVTQYVTRKPATSAGCDVVTDKNPKEAAIVLTEDDLLEVAP
jgi:putative DNA primase/helicase